MAGKCKVVGCLGYMPHHTCVDSTSASPCRDSMAGAEWGRGRPRLATIVHPSWPDCEALRTCLTSTGSMFQSSLFYSYYEIRTLFDFPHPRSSIFYTHTFLHPYFFKSRYCRV